MKTFSPDSYERELIEAFNQGKVRKSRNRFQLMEEAKTVAKNTFRKQQIGLRLDAQDLMKIRAKAVREGIPYQTLISSIVHKYVTGQLAEMR